MASKNRKKEIYISLDKGTFSMLLNRFSRHEKEYDLEGLSLVRAMLSNEKAKMLHVIKNRKPSSIYVLAKELGRGIKSVNDDVKALEKFGFIDLISEKTGKRQRLKPVLIVDSISITIQV